jgi:hypothetical protein
MFASTKWSMRAGFNPKVCNNQWAVRWHGFEGYGVIWDREIILGVIPYSTTLPL